MTWRCILLSSHDDHLLTRALIYFRTSCSRSCSFPHLSFLFWLKYLIFLSLRWLWNNLGRLCNSVSICTFFIDVVRFNAIAQHIIGHDLVAHRLVEGVDIRVEYVIVWNGRTDLGLWWLSAFRAKLCLIDQLSDYLFVLIGHLDGSLAVTRCLSFSNDTTIFADSTWTFWVFWSPCSLLHLRWLYFETCIFSL